MSDIVGIDLGTTNSLIGVMEAGFPILIADENGGRITPSVVYFRKDEEPIVGRPAQRTRALRPLSTIYSIKRFIGVRSEDICEEDVDVAYKVVRRRGGPIRIEVEGRQYSPEDISALVLKKLKLDAERALERTVSRAVISVPAYFNDAQRNATKRAGELAGFSVERIINEPTAAALAYGLVRLKTKSKIAVYDFGGGTFDISILELNEGLFQVLATNGDTRLGGDDIDRALLDRNDEFRMMNDQNRMRILEALVRAKHRLSIEEEVSIDIPFFEEAESFHVDLTRNQLEAAALPIVERTRRHCLRALADAKLAPKDVDAVILVGGVTRMPLVRKLVAEIFEQAPDISQNPDEAVAIGATIQAGMLSGAVRDVVLLDVTPLSLGIETFGGLMNVIVPRNSTIPVKAGEMFTTAVTNQKSMSIKVLQGEREMARDNWKLGEFDIDFEPAPKGVARVGVQFEIDANGILNVLARDVKSGAEKIVQMESAVDVSDEAVEKMLGASLDHAFEDMSERHWIETRIKSEDMLAAVEKAFKLVDAAVDPEERQIIEAATEEIRAALAAREINRLKRANEALDQATQHLAAAVVEHAIDKASGETTK